MIKNKRLTLIPLIIAYPFILFIILSLLLSISSCISKKEVSSDEAGNINYPAYSGFVNDYTNTLSDEWKIKTENLTQEVERKTSCEIAVAIIGSLNGSSIEEYAAGLFNSWGVGKKGKDNGVLLLVSMKDRKLRIEVGYGLEGIITDLEAKEIIDNVIVPRFKENNYNSGIYNGVVAIANKIYKEEGKATVAYSDKVQTTPKKSFTQSKAFPFIIILTTLSPLIFILFSLILISSIIGVVALAYYIKIHKCPKCHKLGLILKQTILVKPTYDSPGKTEIEKSCRYCGYYGKKTLAIPKLSKYSSLGSSSYRSFSSFSSSHSSSNSHSFSSFGGGHSGGGGASGHW
ncbi:MAG: TPM domain-containing protein [Actinobacteria bacterium]|nr:TPM domain-containing protein [Actinomycetota bacterium]